MKKTFFNRDNAITIITAGVLVATVIGVSLISTYASIPSETSSEESISIETAAGEKEPIYDTGSETLSENLASESWLTPVGDDSVYWPTPDEVAAHYPIPGNEQTIDLSTEEWVDDGAHWKGKLLKIKDGIPLEGDNRVYSGVCMVKVNPYCYLLSCKEGLSIRDYENQLVGSSDYSYKDVDDEMVFWAGFYSWYDRLVVTNDSIYKSEKYKTRCEFNAYSTSRNRVVDHAGIQPIDVPNYKGISFVDYIECTGRSYLYNELEDDDYIDIDTVIIEEDTNEIPSSQYYDTLNAWVGQEKIDQLNLRAEEFGIPKELYIVKYIREIIKENGKYDLDYYYKRSEGPSNSFELFLSTGLVVCTGFSDTFESLSSATGITTISVSGHQHRWNETFLNGTWYIIDVNAENSSIY